MLFGKHGQVIWLHVSMWIIALSEVETRKEKLCRTERWHISGGFQDYEGIIEVKINGTWFNVCGNINKEKMCSLLNLTAGYVVLHKTNVFNGSLKEQAIRCGEDDECPSKGPPCSTEVETDHCQPLSICCKDDTRGEQCSGTWSEVHKKQCYKGNNRTNYVRPRSLNLDEAGKNKSWTLSALGVSEENCRDKGNFSLENVRSCISDCLNSENFKKVNVSSTGDCKCTGTNLGPQNDGECYKVLEVVNSPSEDIQLCIAAEITKGIVKFTAENCNRYLQPFCVKVKKDTDTTHKPHKPTLPSDDFDDEPEDKPTSIIAVTCTLGFIATVVMVACICTRCRTRPTKDPLRHNSMFNRTYDRQVRKSGEEYAIISEIELDSGATIYKPPLPDRSSSSPGANTYHTINYNKSESNAAIITLDEYSTPSDMLKERIDVELAAEYSTTYDDPIRHNTEIIKADKHLTEGGDKGRSEQANLQAYESLVDTTKETSADKDKISESKEPTQKNEIEKPNSVETSNKMSEQSCSPLISLKKSRKEVDDSFEFYAPSAVDITSATTNTGEYEDTNIIDGNFPVRPKKENFEEHICLGCLKPEHLKKLGIKLIPEKCYDDLEKRLSEPVRKREDSATANFRKLRRCKTDVARTDDENYLIKLIEDYDPSESTRKCSECNNVYDRLGHIRQTTQPEFSGNDYSHIGEAQKRKI